MSDNEEFQQIVRGALTEARTAYAELRRDDQDRNVVDTAIDTVTAVDTALTDVFGAYFDQLSGQYRVVSEEGVKKGTERDEPAEFTVVLDEIDGTNSLMRRVGHFGPSLAIAEGDDPMFADVVAAGFLDLHHNTLFEAYKGGDAYRTKNWPEHEETEQITTSGRQTLHGENRASMLLDQYMVSDIPAIAALWRQAEPGDYRSSAQHYAWVADGSYDFFITGNHCVYTDEKKMTAEELAAGYLLVTEANGVIRTWNNEKIGERRIGLSDQHTFDIMAAATPAFAAELQAHLP